MNKADIDTLIRLYYKPMCLYATHILNKNGEIEDIVHDAFLALMEKIKAGDPPSSPKAYLAVSVRNRCIDIIRIRNRHQSVTLSDFIPEDASDEEALASSFDEAILWAAIDRLPVGRRQMLLMSKREGLKYSEIACRLGVSERTVRNQISRALKVLRRSLDHSF